MKLTKVVRTPLGTAFLHGIHWVTFDGNKYVQCLEPGCDGHHCPSAYVNPSQK